jgi:hypothetical protein
MKCEFTFRSGRTRLAHARSSGSEILLHIRSLAVYNIDTLKSSFQKRHLASEDANGNAMPWVASSP